MKELIPRKHGTNYILSFPALPKPHKWPYSSSGYQCKSSKELRCRRRSKYSIFSEYNYIRWDTNDKHYLYTTVNDEGISLGWQRSALIFQLIANT